MGSQWPTETLNQYLLKRLDAEVLFEELHDPACEKNRIGAEEMGTMSYFYTDHIQSHPATQGVKALWCPAGPFCYGMWTRPLLLGKEWKPLVTTSDRFTSIPWLEDFGQKKGDKTRIQDKKATIYACRSLGKGRIILNGGDSTIQFINYGFSEFADNFFGGRIYMEKGLDGKKSDGLQLLVSSLRWLAEPSLAGDGDIGGYTAGPPREKKPSQPSPIVWTPAADPRAVYLSERHRWNYPRGGRRKRNCRRVCGQREGFGAELCRLLRRVLQTDKIRLGQALYGMRNA